jgi:hypothetical protein
MKKRIVISYWLLVIGLLATCHLPLATCEAATNLYLNVSDVELVRRLAAITNLEASVSNLNLSTNSINSSLTNLNVTVSNLDTSVTNSLLPLSNRVDLVEADLEASLGNYSNSYLKVSGTWKGSGFNYYYAGQTNSRPMYTVNFGTNIGSDSVYYNSTNWVAVQSVTGNLFNDASDPLIPHHQSLDSNAIPPQVLSRNLTNEYSSGTMYIRFISSAEADLEDAVYLEAWNAIQPFISGSTINGDPYVELSTNGRPVFYISSAEDGYYYEPGYWFRLDASSNRTSYMTAKSWLPPRTAKAANYDGTLATVTNVFDVSSGNLEVSYGSVSNGFSALTKDFSGSYVLLGTNVYEHNGPVNGRPSYINSGGKELKWADGIWSFAMLSGTNPAIYYVSSYSLVPPMSGWLDSGLNPLETETSIYINWGVAVKTNRAAAAVGQFYTIGTNDAVYLRKD